MLLLLRGTAFPPCGHNYFTFISRTATQHIGQLLSPWTMLLHICITAYMYGIDIKAGADLCQICIHIAPLSRLVKPDICYAVTSSRSNITPLTRCRVMSNLLIHTDIAIIPLVAPTFSCTLLDPSTTVGIDVMIQSFRHRSQALGLSRSVR